MLTSKTTNWRNDDLSLNVPNGPCCDGRPIGSDDRPVAADALAVPDCASVATGLQRLSRVFSVVLVIGGCSASRNTTKADVAQARRFDAFPLYWAGRRFERR